jgi:hypothetical protein
MSDGDDYNKMRTIFDRVENSIVTDADPPSIPRADELPASGWAWVIGQRPEGVDYTYADYIIQQLDFFPR